MKIKEIQEIIANFENSSLEILELELEGMKLKLSKRKENDQKNQIQPSQFNYNANEVIKEKTNLTHTKVKSPLVGTYYAAPAPDQKPFIELGMAVKKGQVLCIIEAMKIMNEITAPIDGYIQSMHAQSGDVISYDQVLVVIGETYAK